MSRQDPELAVLSAMAHGHEEAGLSIIQAVLSTAKGLDDQRFRLYLDLAASSLSDAARRALEALMQSGDYEVQTELFRRWMDQGRQEGLHEGEQAALFEVLDARGLVLDTTTRQQILACKDLAQLKLWLRKAATAESVQELFEPAPAPKPEARKAAGKQGRTMKARKPASKR